jgi:hypothetical protein
MTIIGQVKAIERIKIGIWLYLLLLIFEGCLRKWVLPSLSNPLLIIRDPLALWLLFMAAKYQIVYSNVYTKFMLPFTLLCTYIALIFCHQNYYVAAFGARITLLHFPLVFLIGKVLTKQDVIAMGKFIIYLSVPMLLLIIVQFYSPQTDWINRGVGGNLEGAGFSGAEDYFRPPGTFSFTAGNSSYWAFTGPFVFYFLFYNTTIKRVFVYMAAAALLLSILFSISRTILFSTVLSVVFLIISFSRNSKQLGKILGGIVAILVIVYVASKIKALETSLGVFINRFTNANAQEGGLDGVFLDRVLGGLVNGIIHSGDPDKSFFGAGIGYGTNFASKLLTNGEILFLVDEAEWGRIIGELGPLLGILMIGIRLLITIDITKMARVILQKGDPLPWLLLGFSCITLLQGGWSTPTGLGFYVISGGLTVAALKNEASQIKYNLLSK